VGGSTGQENWSRERRSSRPWSGCAVAVYVWRCGSAEFLLSWALVARRPKRECGKARAGGPQHGRSSPAGMNGIGSQQQCQHQHADGQTGRRADGQGVAGAMAGRGYLGTWVPRTLGARHGWIRRFVDSWIRRPMLAIGVLAISPPTPPASTPRCRSSARLCFLSSNQDALSPAPACPHSALQPSSLPPYSHHRRPERDMV
jgi:hypothetical protein